MMGETLEPFDDDGIIPAFGFGDTSTRDRSVFPLRAEASFISHGLISYQEYGI